MQERFRPGAASLSEEQSGRDVDLVDLRALIGAVRRQWVVVSSCVLIFLALGGAYAITAVRQYTATASILVDSSNKQLVDQLLAVSGAIPDDGAILSQVELLKSDGIADAVVTKLSLTTNAEFNAEHGSWVDALHGLLAKATGFTRWFSSADTEKKAVSQDDKALAARIRLEGGLKVERVGRTYVLQISYSSANPKLAATIAQGFADAYLDDQLNSKYDAVRRAGGWLQDRIAELKEKSIESDLAVQKFKQDNGLVGVSTDSGTTLISDQQLSQLNTSLTAARGATSEADAKYRHIESIIESGDVDAAVTDVLDDTVITDMRGKYLDASKREQDIASRLGENHEQAVRLRQEMDEYKQLMFQELGRIAQTYQSTYQVAKAQETSIEAQVEQATGVSAAANNSQVQLRELQREADTYRSLYQNFLQHYQETIQQQSFPVNEARIISNADVPTTPSAPKVPLVLAIAAGLGILVGGALGAGREYRERYFRTGEQVNTELDVEFLGLVPEIASNLLKRRKHRRSLWKRASEVEVRSAPITRFVVDNPMSLFAETMRSAKIAVDLTAKTKAPKVVGIVSTLPQEGKSVVAMNFAAQLAKQGARTLLIDGDMRNPAVSRALAEHAQQGLAEVLVDAVPLAGLLHRDASTGLDVLPTVAKHAVPYSSEMLSSPAMDRLLSEANIYDYVVIDLPPLGLVVDGRAIAGKVDAFLFVVEWGRTPRKVARDMLAREWLVAEKCVGVILNKVDVGRAHLYSAEPSAEYYRGGHSYYSTNAPVK